MYSRASDKGDILKFTGKIPICNSPKLVIPKFNNGHWIFDEQMGSGVGFIYVIRDNYLKRFYIGKKSFKSKKLGKIIESNWRQYNSSSPILKEHFVERGMDEFDFICLEQYNTKGTLSYSETWTLCFVEAPTTKEFYNTRIEAVSWSVKEPITKRHKDRLYKVLTWQTL